MLCELEPFRFWAVNLEMYYKVVGLTCTNLLSVAMAIYGIQLENVSMLSVLFPSTQTKYCQRIVVYNLNFTNFIYHWQIL